MKMRIGAKKHQDFWLAGLFTLRHKDCISFFKENSISPSIQIPEQTTLETSSELT